MIISLIVAASTNNVIGKNNKLPWNLPADLRYFKNTTWGMPVVMGRKTLDALGKPLPGRTNIVLTRNVDFKKEGVFVVSSLEEAVKVANERDTREIFIIGGAVIFNLSLPLAQRVYLTRIHHIIEGDAFFPELNEKDWKLVSNRDCYADDKHAYAYSFQVWERVQLKAER